MVCVWTVPGLVASTVRVVWATLLPLGSYLIVVVIVVVPVTPLAVATLCTARLSPSYCVVVVRLSASCANVWLPAWS